MGCCTDGTKKTTVCPSPTPDGRDNGAPQQLKTDNGPGYKSKVFSTWYSLWGIKHVTGILGNSTGQAIIKYTHAVLKGQLTTLKEEGGLPREELCLLHCWYVRYLVLTILSMGWQTMNCQTGSHWVWCMTGALTGHGDETQDPCLFSAADMSVSVLLWDPPQYRCDGLSWHHCLPCLSDGNHVTCLPPTGAATAIPRIAGTW